MPGRRPLSAALALLVAAPLAFLGSPASAAPAPAKPYDFNGDGFPELVVGASTMLVGKDADGGVAVLASSRSGVAAKAQIFTAASLGLPRDPSGRQEFGGAFASGDFDGDGYADLAIARRQATNKYAGAGAGAVTVLYGSADGLSRARSQELRQPGGPRDDVKFGTSIAAADFDGDGRSDLAVGAPYAEYPPQPQSDGTVSVFPGGAKGLSQDRSTVRRGDQTADDADDYFGLELAVGDLDSDGRPDLVVGARGASRISACYGTADVLSACSQLTAGQVSDDPYSVAVGNVSGTSRPEIVLGVADFSNDVGGSVQTLSLGGTRAEPTVTRSALDQDSKGVHGTAERSDAFGTDIALGDLDDDGYADLVVGAPGEDKGKGRVTVVYGGRKGYRTSGGRIVDQDTKGVPGKAEKDDGFGSTVALLDLDGDGHLDLTVGAPRENTFDGAVTVLRGSGNAFTTKRARTLTLKDLGYATPKDGTFGDALGR